MPPERSTNPLWMLRFAITDLRSRISALKIFLACLILGVTLVAATASLYRVIEQSLLADTRALLGGDVELDTSEPLPDDALEWIRATGKISLVREFDTIVSGSGGDGFFQHVLVKFRADFADMARLFVADEIARAANVEIVRCKLEACAERVEVGQDLQALFRRVGNDAVGGRRHIGIGARFRTRNW